MHRPLLIAAVLLAALPGLEARAQSAGPDHSMMFDPNAFPGAPKAAQPAAKTPPSRDAKKPTRQAQPPQRTAAPARDRQPSATARETPRIEQRQVGRVPFESGTIGITTDRKYSNSTFNDGRVTPGFENVQTREPSYFGFSLSVPTTNSD